MQIASYIQIKTHSKLDDKYNDHRKNYKRNG